MKTLILFFSVLFLFSNIVIADSFYDAAYKMKTTELNSFLKQQLKTFYYEDEDKREGEIRSQTAENPHAPKEEIFALSLI